MQSPSLLLLLVLVPSPLTLAQDFLSDRVFGMLSAMGLGAGRNLEESMAMVVMHPIIQANMVTSEVNKCKGVLPKKCSCTNGKVFSPSSFKDILTGTPCGSGVMADTCTCPSGVTFSAMETAMAVKAQFSLPSCEGADPTSCMCSDGSTFSPATYFSPMLCMGGMLVTCDCPAGDSLNFQGFYMALGPLLQAMQG